MKGHEGSKKKARGREKKGGNAFLYRILSILQVETGWPGPAASGLGESSAPGHFSNKTGIVPRYRALDWSAPTCTLYLLHYLA